MVADGEFREDLFFRLNVVPIVAPPLRERLQDIPALVEAFIASICEDNGFRRKPVDPGVVEALMRYHWPGNVRELGNVVERMVIMSEDRITRRDVPRELTGIGPNLTIAAGTNKTLREFREDMERDYILFKLDELNWNVSKASDVLGIERTNLHKKMKALGIKRS
jgi:two-component system nitrogen regulation response regulator NtrX